MPVCFRTSEVAAALLATSALWLTGCSAASHDVPRGTPITAPAPSVPLKTAEFDGATVSLPDWKPSGVDADDLHTSLVQMGADGEPTGQLDVIALTPDPKHAADIVDATIQSARALNFRRLTSVDRDFVDVPGAASALLNESSYATPAGDPVLSLEVTAVDGKGSGTTVRYTAARDAFNRDLARAIMATLRLK